jgi:2-polyprenyl-3-methyl-5-hydroxy-6-metoxy-1,4-benzoquinol methylase
MTVTALTVRDLDPLDLRIPGWRKDRLVHRNCPLCQRGGLAYARRPDLLTVCFCEDCNMSFVSPAPDTEALGAFYSDYDATHRRGRRVGRRELVEVLKGTDPKRDYRLSTVSRCCDLRGKRLLDVGFGRGAMLTLASRLGAAVEGLELDQKAVDAARRDLGLSGCRLGTIETLPPTPAYHVILMMDLIEHVLDPLSTIREALSRLLPSGLLVLWTPNGSELNTAVQPVQLRVDLEHMQYFTAQAIRSVAKRFDVAVVHLEQTGHPDLSVLGAAHHRRGLQLWTDTARAAVKSIPGFRLVERLRRRNWIDPLGDRHGRYHLFAILQKPAPAGAVLANAGSG